MTYKRFKSGLLLGAFVFSLQGFSQQVSVNPDKVNPEKTHAALAEDLTSGTLEPQLSHKRASRYITHMLSEYHYLKPNLKDNNTLSEKILKRYIKILDGNRSYFTAQDIKEFDRFRYMIDESVRSGYIEPAFEIYQVFRRRWHDRYEFALNLIETPLDFTVKDELVYDREDAEWFKTQEEMNELWRKRVKADALSLVLAEKPWDEVKEILSKRYKMAQRRISQNKSEDVFDLFMNSMALTIEPHASYFSPREAENFDIEMKLSLEGIGAILQTDDVYTKITKLVLGAPAEKSKQLKEGDRIVGVGQSDSEVIDVIGWRLDDVVDLIRGEAGSKVKLQVLPKDEVIAGETKVVELVREKVKLEELSAKSKKIDVKLNGKEFTFGVISVPKFYVDWEAKYSNKNEDYKSTSKDVAAFIKEFEKDKIDGLIIDLRNNGGGALDEAVDLTGLFIDKGPVVQQQDNWGRVKIHPDRNSGVVYDGPLAVLVNGNSASASEIFAGAIQDYGRGLIVGEQTFGKGTVQSLLDLNRHKGQMEGQLGQLKLTTAKFYRVTGETTQHRGVVPDIAFPTAFSREEFGESSYENALAWDTIKAAKYKSSGDVVNWVAKLKESHDARIKKSREFNYLLEDIKEYKVKKMEKTISLNAELRKKEVAERKQQQLERVNQRLIGKGLKPVKTLKDFDESVFDEDDFKLQETGNILADLVVIREHKKLAENK